jgi:hypothetical protein
MATSRSLTLNRCALCMYLYSSRAGENNVHTTCKPGVLIVGCISENIIDLRDTPLYLFVLEASIRTTKTVTHLLKQDLRKPVLKMVAQSGSRNLSTRKHHQGGASVT